MKPEFDLDCPDCGSRRWLPALAGWINSDTGVQHRAESLYLNKALGKLLPRGTPAPPVAADGQAEDAETKPAAASSGRKRRRRGSATEVLHETLTHLIKSKDWGRSNRQICCLASISHSRFYELAGPQGELHELLKTYRHGGVR
jgi:hypothetical protein